MFNTERLPVSDRNLNMLSARGNYFLNSDMLVSVGVSTLNRTYESYDGLFGSPGGFGDALSWHDSATVVGKYSGSEAEQVAANWKSSFQSPDLYYVGPVSYTHLTLPTTPYV